MEARKYDILEYLLSTRKVNITHRDKVRNWPTDVSCMTANYLTEWKHYSGCGKDHQSCCTGVPLQIQQTRDGNYSHTHIHELLCIVFCVAVGEHETGICCQTCCQHEDIPEYAPKTAVQDAIWTWKRECSKCCLVHFNKGCNYFWPLHLSSYYNHLIEKALQSVLYSGLGGLCFSSFIILPVVSLTPPLTYTIQPLSITT